MQRAAASVNRALTDEGLMSQEYFEEAEAGASLIAVLAPEPRLVGEKSKRVHEEIGDVLIYGLLFCSAVGVDPAEAIRKKLALNAQKYPVERAREGQQSSEVFMSRPANARTRRAMAQARPARAQERPAHIITIPQTQGQPICYSYQRWSTPEQGEGDSLRRQTARATAWAEANGYLLSDATYRDEGVSAFSGGNVQHGALGAFLTAVRSGEVPRGSALYVEDLDRVSREHPLYALDTVKAMISATASARPLLMIVSAPNSAAFSSRESARSIATIRAGV